MQKKLIALAVAGLVAAPVFAQSHVTIYGVADLGLNYRSGSSTHKNRAAIDQGLLSGSRIGFKGIEDLGNGLKAAFVLEYAIKPDINETFTANRQSYVALIGDFGTFALGRQYTPQHTLLDKSDPFGTGTVGGIENGYVHPPIRLDNVVAYVSPNFNGFGITAAFTGDGLKDEPAVQKGTKSNAAKVWAISPVYATGPLYVGANLHQIKIDNANTKVKAADLGFTYDFNAVKLHTALGLQRVSVSGTDTNRVKQGMVGLTIPVGEPGKVLLSYLNVKDTETDYKGHKLAVGYTHDLSKRTTLYTAFAKTSKDMYLEKVAGVDNYNKGFNLGLRHKF